MDSMYQAMRHWLPSLALIDAATWFATLNAYVLANPQDRVAMRVLAVVKALSLEGCIDDLVIDETCASPQGGAQGLPTGLTPKQLAHAVVVGSTPPDHARRLARG
ncbi:hypothetical protein D3C73_1322220 [compost metagenome]